MTADQAARWTQIQADFLRNKAMGGDDSDTGTKVVAQLVDLVAGVKGIAENTESRSAREAEPSQQSRDSKLLSNALGKFSQSLQAFAESHSKIEPPQVSVVNQPVPGIDQLLRVLADTIENSIFPLVRSMEKKLEIDLRTHEKMGEVSVQLRELEKMATKKQL